MIWLDNDSAYILTGDAVFEVDLGVGRQSEPKKIVAGQVADDLVVFLGNIYLLSFEGIAKFVPIEAGYSGPQVYLDEKVKFAPDSTMAIDGSVWVASGNKIFKFLRGVRQDFEISGLTSTAGEFGMIYTNADLDNLYVVDRINAALLVIDKNGVYQKVYQAEEFGKAADLVVDEVGERMYLAIDNKILEAGL